MGEKRSQARSQGKFEETAGEIHERLWSWRRGEPEASFDAIMERVRQEREALMKPLVEELMAEARVGEVDVCCRECGARAQNMGKKRKVIQHREGAVEVNREYYCCPSCKQGFFPPGSESGIGEAGMESDDAEDGAAASGCARLICACDE